MILGKHTGKAALVEKLKERGLTASEPVLVDLLLRMKAEAESAAKEDPCAGSSRSTASASSAPGSRTRSSGRCSWTPGSAGGDA